MKMVPKINHILHATDLSAGARKALGYAVALADAFETPLTVIHVIRDHLAKKVDKKRQAGLPVQEKNRGNR